MTALSHTARAANATWWSTLEITARYGVQFFVVLILARLLSPTDFGLIAMLLVFTSIGALLVDSGFSTSLIQRQYTTEDDEATVFWFTSGMGVLLFLALWLVAPSIAYFFAEPTLTPLTRLVAWVLPLSALSAVPDAILTQQLRFKERAKAQAISALISAVVAVSLAWCGYGVWSLAWQALTATGLRGILLWAYAGWRPTGRFRTASFRSLFGFGGYMLLSGLLDTVFVRLQSLLIGKLFDARALGYYTLAQNAQSAPTSFIGGILNRVGLPVFASVADQPEKLVGALRLSLRVTLFLFIPCMTGIALVSKPLIELLYGARWIGAAPILTLLALSAAFWPMHVLNLAALSAQGRSDLFFRLELIKKVIGIILILVCSPGGPIAIAGAVLVGSIASTVINTWYSGKMLGYGALAQLRDQAATIVLAALSAIVGWAILHWTTTGPGATLIAILTSATAYLWAALILHHPALAECISLLRALAAPEIQRPTPPNNP
jgi:O-antigen/teichoic acid export membrane protein